MTQTTNSGHIRTFIIGALATVTLCQAYALHEVRRGGVLFPGQRIIMQEAQAHPEAADPIGDYVAQYQRTKR